MLSGPLDGFIKKKSLRDRPSFWTEKEGKCPKNGHWEPVG